MNGTVEPVTKHALSSEYFQHGYALDIFYKETDHIRQTVLCLLLCFHTRTNASIKGKKSNRKEGNHRQSHTPVYAEQSDAEYQCHNEIGGHSCPEMPHHHFHIVHVFVDDGAYLTQPLIGVETKRELLQLQNDFLADTLHEVEAGEVLTHIGYGIGDGFQNQQTAKHPRCGNERNAFARYITIDKKQDGKHNRRATEGINHKKQCGDNQVPHPAGGQFIQYVAYHRYASSSFSCHLFTRSCVSVMLRYSGQLSINSPCVPVAKT